MLKKFNYLKIEIIGGIEVVFQVEVFTSPSCPYCPMAEQVVEEAKREIGDVMDVEVINIMEDREKALDYGLMAVPAIAINGKIEFLGAPTIEEFMGKLKILKLY